MSDLLIKNIGELVTCKGEKGLNIIKNGAVVVKKGVIVRVGKNRAVLSEIDEDRCRVIDAEGRPMLPGFIDPHTHFVFAGYRDDEFCWRLDGISYQEIMEKGGGIINSVRATREASLSELKELGRGRLDLMLSFGVTTVEGKTGYGLDLENELKQLQAMKELKQEHPLEIAITFLGAHAFPPEYSNNHRGYVDYLIEKMLPAVKEEGGAEFIDVFCDQGAFSVQQSREILKAGLKQGLKVKLHADEIAGTGGAELAAELGSISADHLLKASDRGIAKMAASGTTPVLLPLTAFSLKEDYAPARKMFEAGLPVALATDLNPGSCYSESIPLLIALSTLYMGLSIEEAIRGLTVNAARAIDREDEIGTIEPGKQADMIIISAPSYTHLGYHFGVNLVERVIKGGQIVK